LDHKLVEENFERAELRFVERLLRPGMVVLDIGAHHGLYTLLASKCVGRKGQVIASSDLLHTNGLFVVGSVFASLRAVEWLTGRPTRFNPNGMTVDIRTLPSWSRYRFLAGANKYIQQESTFWRRSLWEKAGGELHAAYRDGGGFRPLSAIFPSRPSLLRGCPHWRVPLSSRCDQLLEHSAL
jgi:hypothetical protein